MSAVTETNLDRLEVFATGLDHPEGIAVTLDGQIYVGGEAGQVYAISDQGAVRVVASTGGFNLGLAADGAGRLYVCDTVARCVWRVDPATGKKEVFCSGTPDRPMVQPNWGCFDANGNFYVTDSGHWGRSDGMIWVVPPGRPPRPWSLECRAFPNGCTVPPEGDRLLVLESYPSALAEIPIKRDGSAGDRQTLDVFGTIVPDGVAVTTDGPLVIACYRPDAIYTWDTKQGLEVLAADPRGTVLAAPTNVAFTGPDLGTLVVPNIGRWHLTRARLGIYGAPLNYPAVDLVGP